MRNRKASYTPRASDIRNIDPLFSTPSKATKMTNALGVNVSRLHLSFMLTHTWSSVLIY